MLITLTTDGSYCHMRQKSGYAFWVSSSAGRFQRYGSLKAKNPTEAELMAIANGLHFCRTHPELKDATKIVLNIDCIGYKNLIEGKKTRRWYNYRRIIGVISKYRGVYNGKKCEVELRWVQAHTNDLSESRKYVNNWVDCKAKLALK